MMSTAAPMEETAPARPSAAAELVTAQDAFQPILFLLSSLSTDNIDAATVARLLQPHFKPGDFYVVNAAAFVNASNSPAELRRTGGASPSAGAGGGISLPSTSGSSPEFVKDGVQNELNRIAAAREEARQAAAQAKIAQLAALQEEYIEDGLSPEDALAAAQAELREESGSEEDQTDEGGGNNGGVEQREGGGRRSAGAPLKRLPPCVCVLNVPLTCSAIDLFARSIPGVAAVLLLESRCCVRELVSGASAAVQAGGAGTGDKPKGRGISSGRPRTSTVSKSGSSFTDDLLEYLNGTAVQLNNDGNGLPNVLVQRVEYPTENTERAQGSAAGAAFRPSVSPSNFVLNLHSLLLRIFWCWLRYESWRENRVSVRVPPYIPPHDAEATEAAAEGKAPEEPANAPLGFRTNKQKSASPAVATGSANLAAFPSTTSADMAAVAALHPHTMAEVAAEHFEYSAFMQCWAAAQEPNIPHTHPTAALHACLAACLHQVSCGQGTSVLRSRAEISAAQLREDVKAATEKCAHSYNIGSGARAESCLPKTETKGAVSPETIRCEVLTAPFSLNSSTEDPTTDEANPTAAAAETIEAALAQCISAEMAGSVDALSAIAVALVSTAGGGDALHWLRRALVAREQRGWHTSSHFWRSTTLCCMQRPARAHRIAHSAFVFRGPTTFPQFYHDENFIESEERVYELDSSDNESDAEEEEEEGGEEEDPLEDSAVDTQSTASADSAARPSSAKASADATETAIKPKTSVATSAPAAPLVDHTSLVLKQLQRRRVLEQVRASHTRPPLQEVGVFADLCQAVVTETNWMRAADGTLIEVARTAANSSQVRCTVMADPSGTVCGGYMLECPAPLKGDTARTNSASASTATPDTSPGGQQPQQQPQSPELTVDSGVRGFLSVDDRLRVFTKVVADNSREVELATYALAVAAAKEAAVAQYEAQFAKGAKGAKGREKSSGGGAALSLDEITATLLDAVPKPLLALPSSDEASPADLTATATSMAAAPPLMQVHALFPSQRCVLTAVMSKADVPGVRLAVLSDSEHVASGLPSSAAPALPSALFSVHLWWDNELCALPVRQLSAVHFYVDGVAELFSPDLPPAVRVLLHHNGSYLTEVGACRLFVNPRGCCTLYCGGEGVEDAVVVHKLNFGWATAVTNTAVRRAEREDGLQQEFVTPEKKTKGANLDSACGLGVLAKTFFGPGVAVHRGDGAQTWLWHVAGMPMITCDAAARNVSAALDSEGADCLLYVPEEHMFQLLMKNSMQKSSSSKVAATFYLRSSRLMLWSKDRPHYEEKAHDSVFVVDCAYGGVCGRVQASHLYRVSPFGRCSEEVAVMQSDLTHWQLVLPPQYKRPKKKEPEVMLLPEYTSEAFHRAAGGTPNRGEPMVDMDSTSTAHVTTVLHLQRCPPELSDEAVTKDDEGIAVEQDEDHKVRDRHASSSIFAGTVTASTNMQGPQVRCVAFDSDGTTVVTVMDAASWSKYAQWLMTIPEKALHMLPSREVATPTHSCRVLAFEVEEGQKHTYHLHPLTVVDDKEASEPVPPAQRCILLHHFSDTSSTATAPAWCASSEISNAIEECRRSVRDMEVGKDIVSATVEEAHTDTEKDNAHDAFTMTASEPQLELTGRENEQRPTSAAAPHDKGSEPTKPTQMTKFIPLLVAKDTSRAVNYWSSPCCPRFPLSEAPPTPSRSENGTGTSATSASTSANADTTTAAASAMVDAAASAPSLFSVPHPRKMPSRSSKVPLMQSYIPPGDEQTGTTASSRFHSPLLLVQPRLIDFGNVHRGSRYVAKFELINTSTVPCRYRIRASPVVKPFLVVSYPRHFVAPGITVEVAVELSGWQPHGVVDSELTVVHEGGATEVGVVWCTTDATRSVQMGRGVVCAGWSVRKPVLQHPLQVAASDSQDGEMMEAEKQSCEDSDSGSDVSAEVRAM